MPVAVASTVSSSGPFATATVTSSDGKRPQTLKPMTSSDAMRSQTLKPVTSPDAMRSQTLRTSSHVTSPEGFRSQQVSRTCPSPTFDARRLKNGENTFQLNTFQLNTFQSNTFQSKTETLVLKIGSLFAQLQTNSVLEWTIFFLTK
jgi:hypothetical protein